MKWHYKRFFGLLAPIFILGLAGFVYYSFIVNVCVEFYAAAGLTWLAALLGFFFHVFFIMFVWSYIQCVFTDAGPVPDSWKGTPGSISPTMTAVEEGRPPPVFCTKCLSFKPERCHHCSTCEQCVLKMDHHCALLLLLCQCG